MFATSNPLLATGAGTLFTLGTLDDDLNLGLLFRAAALRAAGSTVAGTTRATASTTVLSQFGKVIW